MSKKLIGIIASFALVLSVVGANTASALTASDISMLLNAGIINATQAASLSASIAAPVASASGYTFAKDLTVGSRGADVTALQNMLGVSPATGYFGALTKAALIKFQLSKGITPAAGYFGPKTRGIVNAGAPAGTTGTTGTVVSTGTDLVVSLAATSPASGAIVAGQSIANLVVYTFTNKSATPAVVTNVTLQRGGVSNDADLTNIYLYSGVTRLTDAASISTGKITFNAPTGLFTVPAGSSITVAVRSDICTTAVCTNISGQILVISLTGVTANVPVSASYPVSGASQSISTATLASVAVASTSPATTSIDPQNDYVMWQGTVNVGTNDVWMKSIALRQVGSVSAGDLGNFKLFLDGVQIGSTLQAYDANSYLTFDLSASPVKVTATNHTLKLIGDIIGGSTKNFSFSLRQASDINVVDSQLNVNVLATAAATFPLTSGVQTVNGGSLTVERSTVSPSGNVTLTASAIALARFKLTASGEPVKIESLKVNWAGASRGNIRNGALFISTDGTTYSQVGSTADIASSTAATAYTTYNLGSSLIVNPGTPVTLEVRGDVYASAGTQWVSADAMTISLLAGSSNGTLQKSLGNLSTQAASGNQLTVSQGTLSLSKQGAYANQSIIVPQTAMKLGSYVLTAGTTEDLNINTITVNFLGAGASSTATTTNLYNVYVNFGGQMTSNKATIVSGDNAFQVNYVLPKGTTKTIDVYGTLSSSVGAADVFVTKLQVVGQTSNSIQTVSVPSASTYITGQSISVTGGVLNASAYAIAASSTVVAGNQVKAGSYKFTATGDTFTIDQLIGFVPFAAAGNVSSVIYKVNGSPINGSGTPIDTSDGANAMATTTGLSIVVPANSSTGVVVDAYLQLASIGTPGAATSSTNVIFTLKGYEKVTSTGVQSQVGNANLAGNTQYAYASVPTISNVALSDTTLQSASGKTLARFSVSADSAGGIDWKVIKFTITKPSTVSLGSNSSDLWSLTDDSGNTIAGTIASSTDLASTTISSTGGTITFTATTPETIGAGQSKTYRLKTTIGNGSTYNTGDAVTTRIAQGTAGHIQSTTASAATTNASFVWSDNSYTIGGHSVTTPDWNNDILVKNIPTDSQNLTF